MKILKGIPVAPGVAIARPFLLERSGNASPLRQNLSEAEVERDIVAFRDAVEKTAEGIRRRATGSRPSWARGTAPSWTPTC